MTQTPACNNPARQALILVPFPREQPTNALSLNSVWGNDHDHGSGFDDLRRLLR